MSVPLVDLRAQQDEIDDEGRAGLAEVFAKTAFIGGPAVSEFEKAYADAMGIAHCVGVANGTDALELAMRAVGVARPLAAVLKGLRTEHDLFLIVSVASGLTLAGIGSATFGVPLPAIAI